MARTVESCPRDAELRPDAQLRADVHVSVGDNQLGDTAMGEEAILRIGDSISEGKKTCKVG